MSRLHTKTPSSPIKRRRPRYQWMNNEMTPLYRPRCLLLLLFWLVVSKPAWSRSPSTGLECEQVNRRQKWSSSLTTAYFFLTIIKKDIRYKIYWKKTLKHKQSVQPAMLLLFLFFTKAGQPAEQKEAATWKSNMEIKERWEQEGPWVFHLI